MKVSSLAALKGSPRIQQLVRARNKFIETGRKLTESLHPPKTAELGRTYESACQSFAMEVLLCVGELAPHLEGSENVAEFVNGLMNLGIALKQINQETVIPAPLDSEVKPQPAGPLRRPYKILWQLDEDNQAAIRIVMLDDPDHPQEWYSFPIRLSHELRSAANNEILQKLYQQISITLEAAAERWSAQQ